jgi:predicted metalloprotease with PDZ domain
MDYKISYKEPHKHFINIELRIDQIAEDLFYLQLPAWRPGRYELQNYARNIQKLEIFSLKGDKLNVQKTSREQWEVQTKGTETIVVRYNCFCYQMDAGGAWLDENQLYLNFIYCLIYGVGREKESCTIELDIPNDYKIACGLPQKDKVLYGNYYFQLADSPMIASASLIHQQYEVNGIAFNIWIEGEVHPDWNQILNDFKKFTEASLDLFGTFPEKDYYFLYQILPHKQYHGVEHSNSTIITLGPAENFNTLPFYENFLGISCHELFHAWNALKIRPKEMMPYDLTRENYFRTGFVIEGITTYYGDLLLARSGAFSITQYFKELDCTFQKHFDNFGRFNLSVADSSYDLWVDGYSAGIPNRKVSIYDKGAVVALILDLEIRKITDNAKSLDDVMRILWNDYGKKGIGYSEKDYQNIVEKISGKKMDDYFLHCIYGTDPLEDRLNQALHYIGCSLQLRGLTDISEKVFGFKTNCRDNRIFVSLIEPGSPADKAISKDDEIIAVNDEKISGNNVDLLIGDKTIIKLSLIRFGKLIHRELKADGGIYLKKYSIVKRSDATNKEKENFKQWVKNDF